MLLFDECTHCKSLWTHISANWTIYKIMHSSVFLLESSSPALSYVHLLSSWRGVFAGDLPMSAWLHIHCDQQHRFRLQCPLLHSQTLWLNGYQWGLLQKASGRVHDTLYCTVTQLTILKSTSTDWIVWHWTHNLTLVMFSCRIAHFWIWSSTLNAGRKQHSGRIPVYGLAGSRA